VGTDGTSALHTWGDCETDTASSSIKQVAAGRFGVTPEYLMNAKQLEIKIAQVPKPGEGGQLPGQKVSPYIANAPDKTGSDTDSAPPRYLSIEDPAQLILTCTRLNPKAQVSVKLVAEIGIGTVAAGVAKKQNARFPVMMVARVPPLSSIKHAGGPWELGLTEVHRVNGK